MAAKITVGQITQFATDVQWLEHFIDPQIKELQQKKDEKGMRLLAIMHRLQQLQNNLMGAELTIRG